jgi:hypothetical protein
MSPSYDHPFSEISREIGALEERTRHLEGRISGMDERLDRQLAIINVKLDRLQGTDDQNAGGLRLVNVLWMSCGP